MTFSFNNAIPDANNDPSADQPDMKTNNISTNALLAVDHISFNTLGGGKHKQVTFINKNVPLAQTDPASTLYTDSGTASTVAELNFRNQNGIFPISSLKAFGVFTTLGLIAVPTVAALDMGANVTLITISPPGRIYTIDFPAGIINGTTVIVFLNSNIGNDTLNWTFTANTLTITNNGSPIALIRKISFAIYQV